MWLPPPLRGILDVTGRGEEAVLAGKCATAGALRGGGADAAAGAGRGFQEAAGSADGAAAGRAGAAPPGPARSAQRDSALTHRARCQWISPSPAPARPSSPPPAPRALSCTPDPAGAFSRLYSLWIPTKAGKWLALFSLTLRAQWPTNRILSSKACWNKSLPSSFHGDLQMTSAQFASVVLGLHLIFIPHFPGLSFQYVW